MTREIRKILKTATKAEINVTHETIEGKTPMMVLGVRYANGRRPGYAPRARYVVVPKPDGLHLVTISLCHQHSEHMVSAATVVEAIKQYGQRLKIRCINL